MERSLIVAPSVLSADFSDIRGALSSISGSGTSWVHLDVMDGTFVPNITYGPKFIADMRPHSSLFFDAHLMVAEPSRYIEQFAAAGCDCITALNCDGGTTAMLWFRGSPVMRCSNSAIPDGRHLPNAWVYVGD